MEKLAVANTPSASVSGISELLRRHHDEGH
jgi:hypothetical protein